MVGIQRIALTDTSARGIMRAMFQTHAPTRAPATAPITSDEAWLAWRPETPADSEQLSVAQLAECRCPELCDRDHANE